MSEESSCAVLLRRWPSATSRHRFDLRGARSRMPGLELGERTRSLVRLAALVATESAAPSYQWAVTIALAAGA